MAKNKGTRGPKARKPQSGGKSRTQKSGLSGFLEKSRPVRQALSGIGTTIAPFLPPQLRVPVTLASTLLGKGSYSVANTLTKGLTSNETGLAVQVPDMHSSNNGFRVQHKEFIMDITGATGFMLYEYLINPSSPATFPWLSSIASSFAEYQFHGLAFEFKSTSANALNSTNTALGTVVMAPIYNVDQPDFTSKLAMEAALGSASCKPSESAVSLIECAQSHMATKRHYLRNNVTTVSNALLYDYGRFNLAVTGMQAAAVIGELWVSYDVSLYLPQLSPYGPPLTNSCNLHFYTTSGMSGAAPLGTPSSAVIYSNSLQASWSTTVITLNPNFLVNGAIYFVEHTFRGVSAGATTNLGVTGSACFVAKGSWQGYTASSETYPQNGLAAAQQLVRSAFLYTAGSTAVVPTLTFSSCTPPGSLASVEVNLFMAPTLW